MKLAPPGASVSQRIHPSAEYRVDSFFFDLARSSPVRLGELMPIYEYEPTVFSHEESVSECCFFETLQSLSEPPLSQCPTCGHVIHRALSGFAFSVKSAPAAPQSQISISGTGRGGPNATGGGLFQSSLSHDPAGQADQAGQTSGGRAARLAMRHICSSGCRH